MVRKALHELPKDLNATYARILANVPESAKSIVKELLTWLSFAYRPLRQAELLDALAFEEFDTTLDPEGRLLDSQALIGYCQGLITESQIGYFSRRMILSHSSVRAFLVSEQIKDGPASFYAIDSTAATQLLMRKCLTCKFRHSSAIDLGQF